MKKSLAIILFLFSSFSFSQYSPTPNIGLEIPSNGSTNWNIPLNYNFNRLDLLLSGGIPIPGLDINGNLTVTGNITAGSIAGAGGNFVTSPPINQYSPAFYNGPGASTLLGGITPVSGILKWSSTGPPQIITAADIVSLWTGTCTGTNVLQGNGVCGTGGSGSLPSGTGLVAVVSGSGGLATPSQTVSALSFSSGSEFYGDSTTCSTGASATTSGLVYSSATQNGYPGLLMPIVGGDLNNNCKSGDTEVDTNNWVFKHLDNEGVGSPTYFLEDFINDSTSANALNTGYQNSVKYGYQGQIIFAGLPRANKVFAQDPAVTSTGFTPDTSYQYGWGASSTTNGSVFNCPATVGSDGHFIFWSYMADGNGGTWTGLIDSIGLTDPITTSSTFTATGYSGTAIAGQTSTSQYVAYLISGLSAGTHTFHGTVTSSTGAGNVVDFGGCSGLPASNVNFPQVLVAGVPYQNTGGATDSTTALYNGIASSLVTSISAFPLNVHFVDIRNSLLNTCGAGNEATMFATCYADFKHQNNVGYAAEVSTASTGYVAVLTAANSSLTTGALKNPRNGPTAQYYDRIPIDTSHWYNFNGGNGPGHGLGVIFNCANAGQNCDGIGDLPNYGLTLTMGGNNFSLINLAGTTVTPINTSTAIQFITATPSGALCFFGNNGSCSVTPFVYITGNTMDIGGLPGYQQAGTWITTASAGISTGTSATSGSNQSSNFWRIRGNYWNGTVNQPTDITMQNIVGSGTTPSQTLTVACGFSMSTCAADFTALTAGVKLSSTSLVGGQLICVVTGTNCPSLSSLPFSGISTGTNNVALLIGSGGSLGTSGTGTNAATSIGGITVTGTPAVNQQLTATSTSAANWQTPGGHSNTWRVDSAQFVTGTMLGGVFYEPGQLTYGDLIIRQSGTISCTVAPNVNIMDLGTSITTAYGSATSWVNTATATSDGVFSPTGLGVAPITTPGHFYGLAFSAGTCVTAPTFDITLQL